MLAEFLVAVLFVEVCHWAVEDEPTFGSSIALFVSLRSLHQRASLAVVDLFEVLIVVLVMAIWRTFSLTSG